MKERNNVKNSPFFKQVDLMLRVLPSLHDEKRFAIKGGTALNFFLLDMPRLSVDIDLTFLPLLPRDESLLSIGKALDELAVRIRRMMPDVSVVPKKAKGGVRTTKLFVRRSNAQIKIEPNEIIRGCVFPCEEHTLVKNAEDLFELSVSVNSLSRPDLYGGKLCATLDRQHPRDFFDIKLLMENEGITDQIRQAFVVYLASHNRPINELLDPTWQDIRQLYENEFNGIAAIDVSYDELIATRGVLLKELVGSLTDRERKFLLSIKRGEPEWDMMDIEELDKLPAIQWKVQNVRRMSKAKHDKDSAKLTEILGI